MKISELINELHKLLENLGDVNTEAIIGHKKAVFLLCQHFEVTVSKTGTCECFNYGGN